MTKNVIALVVLICCYAGIASGAETFPLLGVITADNVNIRAGQHVNFQRACQLHKGDEVVVVGRNYDWYKVRLPESAIVYINSRFLGQRIGDVAVVTATRVNVRTGPGEKNDVVGKANQGSYVRVKADTDGWSQVEPMDGMYGWVAAEFVSVKSRNVPAPKIITRPSRNIYLNRRAEQKTVETPPSAISAPPIPQETQKQHPEELSIVGYIDNIGRVVPETDIRYKLVIDGQSAYFLQGPRYLMDSFVHYKVRVYGEIKDASEPLYEYPVIAVSRVKLVL